MTHRLPAKAIRTIGRLADDLAHGLKENRVVASELRKRGEEGDEALAKKLEGCSLTAMVVKDGRGNVYVQRGDTSCNSQYCRICKTKKWKAKRSTKMANLINVLEGSEYRLYHVVIVAEADKDIDTNLASLKAIKLQTKTWKKDVAGAISGIHISKARGAWTSHKHLLVVAEDGTDIEKLTGEYTAQGAAYAHYTELTCSLSRKMDRESVMRDVRGTVDYIYDRDKTLSAKDLMEIEDVKLRYSTAYGLCNKRPKEYRVSPKKLVPQTVESLESLIKGARRMERKVQKNRHRALVMLSFDKSSLQLEYKVPPVQYVMAEELPQWAIPPSDRRPKTRGDYNAMQRDMVRA